MNVKVDPTKKNKKKNNVNFLQNSIPGLLGREWVLRGILTKPISEHATWQAWQGLVCAHSLSESYQATHLVDESKGFLTTTLTWWL